MNARVSGAAILVRHGRQALGPGGVRGVDQRLQGLNAVRSEQGRALLRQTGRSRGIDAEATRLREALRARQMRQLPLVEQAMGRQAVALLGQLDAACTAAADLEQSFRLMIFFGMWTSYGLVVMIQVTDALPKPAIREHLP